ncbi:hypothetical protein EDF31_102554 [Curtobacterium sp. PhB142]|uniref:DUF5677 domain-containing protein n=1 Tax=unclassified Curtobacterium TaxID=257496 RepID=UPI00104808C3|nr:MULTISPECIES: DUF5677 domain-containing protein [unclassified Curtobacterium]TCL87845.1 hypothetical protein EDF31_102554 [Curtobacterium sp. PhB142]TCM04806.1 hypothetical protein EDF26_10125 [Curtobacterium sp. PhB134]
MPSSAGPTDHRAVIRRLIAIWDAEADRKTVAVRTDIDLQVTVLVRGLTAHAVECAQGVLALYAASHPVAAVPIIRSLMEDSVTAGWVLVVPNGWKDLLSNGSKARAQALRGAMEAKASGADDDWEVRRKEYEDQVKDLGPASPSFTIFEQRLNAIEGTQGMYLVYRYLSGLTHAGAETVDLYTAGNPNAGLPVSYRRHAAHGMAALLLAHTSMSLLQSLIAWDTTQVGRPHQAELDSIADQLRVGNEWRLRTTDR